MSALNIWVADFWDMLVGVATILTSTQM